MPLAARITDTTQHGAPLAPGPASPNVRIGRQKAWRALPTGATGAALEAAAGAIQSLMSSPTLTPADAAPQLAQIQGMLQDAGSKATVEGNAGAGPAAASANAGLSATNATLAATWTSASAPPGAMPAATAAYTEAIKAAVASAAGAVFSAIAGAADTHNCPRPCPNPLHGPGVVTRGSKTVRINGLPAVRQGDKVIEACGGSDPIAAGCGTVRIGDESGIGGGGAGTAASDQSNAAGGDSAPKGDATDEVADLVQRGVTASVDSAAPGQAGPLVPAAAEQAEADTTWIGIVLCDFDDTPVPNQDFVVTLKSGQVLNGRTDENGHARFDGLQPDHGEVRFTRIPDSEENHAGGTANNRIDGADEDSSLEGPGGDW